MSSGAIKAGGVFVEIGADPTKFFSALKNVNKSIASMGKAMQMSGAKMAGIGAGVVAPIFASAKAFADVGSALNDMSKRTGVATDSLSVLKYAAEQTGTDMGGVETAIKKMQKAIFAAGSGSKEAAEALAMVGLSAADLEGMSADQQMGRIADGLMAIQDPGERAAIAMKIFGKAGTDILPMLEGGSAGMAAFAADAKRLGLVMDADTAAKADSLGDAIDALTSSMRIAFIQIGAAVAPMLTDMANGMAVAAASVGRFITNNQALVVSAFKIGVALIAAGTAVSALGSVVVGASSTMGALGGAAKMALSPMTMLIGVASGVGKSFTLAMPATLKLANQIGASMLGASASVLSFASTAGTSLAGFATSSATGLAGLASSSVAGFTRMSNAAQAAAQAMFPVFFTGFNRGIAAGAGFFSATLRGLSGVVMASSGLRGAMSAVSGSGMAKFVTDIVGGLTLTYKSFVWWATGATARMAQYTANLTGAVGKTIASTAAMSAAWVGSALRGVAVFAGGAVAGIASYIGAAAMAVAASVASAATVAAAWLAPLAPFLLLAAAAVGVGVAVKQFGGQIGNALGGVGEMAGQAGSAITKTLGSAVADGIVVFGDLAATATTTFTGIYEAVAAGDLSGAMDILWAGLLAGWLRGVEALMSYVDPWVAAFQDVFTDLGASIYIAWDTTWVYLSNSFNTFGAVLQGAFDNTVNGVLASWDVLEAGIKKSWNYIQSFFTAGFDLEAENNKVDSDMTARARERELKRPGVKGRMEEAAKKNAEATADLGVRTQGVRDGAQATKEGRQAANAQRAVERRAGVEAAEGNLTSLVSGKRDTRARTAQVDDLLGQIKGATSVDQLAGVGSLGDQFSTLRDLGRLTSDQEMMLSEALDKAAEKLTGTSDSSTARPDPGAIQDQAAAAAKSAEVVGTFSSSLGGMGFGSNIDQLQLAALNKIAENTKNQEEGAVAA